MHTLYNLLLSLLTPFALLRLIIKSRHNPAYRQHIAERFAYHLAPAPTAKPLWIHAVSVGEFLALIPLLEKLLTAYPHLPLWITCTTPTGRAQIAAFAANHPQRIRYSYLPYDSPHNIRRFLRHLSPRGLILMETEIWINLLHENQRQQIPTLLINARLSKKSLRGYSRFARPLLQKVLPKLCINAQNRADAKRFRSLCRQNPIHITPSLKFASPNNPPPPLNGFLPPNPQAPLWIAASTHEGEESLILQTYQQLLVSNPNLRLCIAPRHPERRENIKKYIAQAGFTPLLRSQDASLSQAADGIALLDSLGELSAAMQNAAVAFIGGSLIPRGGHNPLEAIHAGIPVCFGPSMFNFQHIAEQLRQEAFVRQCSAAELSAAIQTLMDYHRQHGKQTITAYAQQHSGDILEKHLAFIAQFIPIQAEH